MSTNPGEELEKWKVAAEEELANDRKLKGLKSVEKLAKSLVISTNPGEEPANM